MGNINSYFKLLIKDGATYINLIPVNGPLEVDEVFNYLTKLNLKTFDAVELTNAIKSNKECEIRVASREIEAENESLVCKISKDRMVAQVRFYMPSNIGRELSKDEIIELLGKNGVVYGINKENIDKFISNRQYCVDIDIAKGVEPINGKSAVIHYNFKTSTDLKPKLNEDGSVDFHSLDNINKVLEGDVLATMERAIPSKDGRDVMGTVLKPQKTLSKQFKYGNNIYVSEDGLSLITKVNGHVYINGDTVNVSDMYEVMDSVDNNTGDIDFNGSVHIHGSVMSGFKVRAKGDIIVDGVVECAQVVSGGNIIVKKGVQGRKKGILMAKGNIVSKFIESAIVRADGNIQTEAIMYSDIACKGCVIVNGKKGNIVGGTTRAIKRIECKTVGSQMETKTEIEVGIDPDITNEITTLEKDIATIQTQLTNDIQKMSVLKKRLEEGKKLNAESLLLLKTTSVRYNENMSVMEEKTERYSQLKTEVAGMSTGEFEVHSTAYVGVKISIGNAFMYTRKEIVRSKFKKMGAAVEVAPLI